LESIYGTLDNVIGLSNIDFKRFATPIEIPKTNPVVETTGGYPVSLSVRSGKTFDIVTVGADGIS
jgi:hypothetical protein